MSGAPRPVVTTEEPLGEASRSEDPPDIHEVMSYVRCTRPPRGRQAREDGRASAAERDPSPVPERCGIEGSHRARRHRGSLARASVGSQRTRAPSRGWRAVGRSCSRTSRAPWSTARGCGPGSSSGCIARPGHDAWAPEARQRPARGHPERPRLRSGRPNLASAPDPA